MVAVLSSSIDAPLVVDLLSLTDVARYARLTVSTNWYHIAILEQIFACKETVMCTGTVLVTRKLAEGKLSFPSASYIFIMYCDVLMTHMKFYNYHVKRSEI